MGSGDLSSARPAPVSCSDYFQEILKYSPSWMPILITETNIIWDTIHYRYIYTKTRQQWYFLSKSGLVRMVVSYNQFLLKLLQKVISFTLFQFYLLNSPKFWPECNSGDRNVQTSAEWSRNKIGNVLFWREFLFWEPVIEFDTIKDGLVNISVYINNHVDSHR